mgnify:FL=1
MLLTENNNAQQNLFTWLATSQKWLVSEEAAQDCDTKQHEILIRTVGPSY